MKRTLLDLGKLKHDCSAALQLSILLERGFKIKEELPLPESRSDALALQEEANDRLNFAMEILIKSGFFDNIHLFQAIDYWVVIAIFVELGKNANQRPRLATLIQEVADFYNSTDRAAAIREIVLERVSEEELSRNAHDSEILLHWLRLYKWI